MSASSAKPDFFESSRAEASGHELHRKLASARYPGHAAEACAEFPAYESECDAARRIKEESIARLDELLIQLKERLEENGCVVHFAAGAAEARGYVAALAKKNGLKRAVICQSMTAAEIGLNEALAGAGLEVAATSLGEYIVQLRGEQPPHIVTPAIHLSKEEIGALFAEKFKVPYTAEPEALAALARERLRATLLGADLGIAGVNFAIAETGTLVLVENEGNGRFAGTLADTFVAVLGIEKVIPRPADLPPFLEILARTATGQKISAYTNFISGPRRGGEIDGPREVHVVIVDNGRSAMLADAVMREALYCIRCGACLDVCPVYRRIGGHAYGSAYPGPIGSVISPNLFGGAAGHLPFASTLCGACRDICPVRIDLPRLLLHLRWKETEGPKPAKWPRAAGRARAVVARFAKLARYPRTIRVLTGIAAVALAPLSRKGWIRRMPPPFNAWTKLRDFPRPRARRRRKPTHAGPSGV